MTPPSPAGAAQDPSWPTRTVGWPVTDPTGELIGHITEVLIDAMTGHPEWAKISPTPGPDAATTNTPEWVVPVETSDFTTTSLRLSYAGHIVENCPATHNAAGHHGQLSLRSEAALYRHYGLT